MNNILFRFFFKSEESRQIKKEFPLFLREYLELNLNRLHVVCIVLLISETFLYITPERAFNYHSILFPFILVDAVLIILIGLIRINYKKYKYWQLNLLQTVVLCNVLLLATNLNLSSITHTDYIHPFIITLTFIATALELSPQALTGYVVVTATYNLIGMFLLQSDKAIFFTNATNVAIFSIIAWTLGIMVSRTRVLAWLSHREVIRQNEILEDLTKRDQMTRFFNHESILSHLEQQIAVSKTDGEPLCVLILDVDDFKKINDTYGHLEGDKVLLMIAKSINLSVRVSDIIGRYGGEEFFLIFPKTDFESAKIVSERIRSSIQQAGIISKINVTISGGMALHTGESVDEMIRKADQRLYKAKDNGKNQIVSS